MFLDKSIAINTLAWLPNEPISPLPVDIYLSGSSEYNQNSTDIIGNVISTSTTPYLVAQISASYIPSASGWYILTPYGAIEELLFWQTNTDPWDNSNDTWETCGLTTGASNQIRIYVSGSNDPQINVFVSSNEDGTFTRYISSNETGNFTRYVSNNENATFSTNNS